MFGILIGMRCRLSDRRLGKFRKVLTELLPFTFFYIETLLARDLEKYLSYGIDI